jgi:hypothetical protein
VESGLIYETIAGKLLRAKLDGGAGNDIEDSIRQGHRFMRWLQQVIA